MTLLNEANKIYLGGLAANAVYGGAEKVWPSGWGPKESIYAPSSVPAGDGSDANTFATGNDILITTGGRITAIRYYRPAGSLASREVKLWTNTGVFLAGGTATGSIAGWNSFPITPLIISGATAVRVAQGYSGSGDLFPYTNATHVSVSPHLTWQAGVYSPFLPSGGEGGFPDSVNGAYHYFTDIVFEATNTNEGN